MNDRDAILKNLMDLADQARFASPAVCRTLLNEAWFVLNDAQDANNALLRTAQEIETEMMP